MTGKVNFSGIMRVKVYTVLSECIERGVSFGWARAHKHTDKPVDSFILDTIQDAVMADISDYFDFDGDAVSDGWTTVDEPTFRVNAVETDRIFVEREQLRAALLDLRNVNSDPSDPCWCRARTTLDGHCDECVNARAAVAR